MRESERNLQFTLHRIYNREFTNPKILDLKHSTSGSVREKSSENISTFFIFLIWWSKNNLHYLSHPLSRQFTVGSLYLWPFSLPSWLFAQFSSFFPLLFFIAFQLFQVLSRNSPKNNTHSMRIFLLSDVLNDSFLSLFYHHSRISKSFIIFFCYF